MKFSDSGIIISVRKYSESSLIVKVLSNSHGLYSGFVRGATSSPKNRIIYQNFNLVDFEWSSKVEDNLGFFKIELQKSFLADIISSPVKLSALGAISHLIEQNVLEREPVEEIFSGLLELLQKLSLEDEVFLKQYIQFEIDLLQVLGYGIDLSECAATGATEDLHFVSPKSARAVCLAAGEKYRDKLLILPQFLLENNQLETTKEDLLNGLKLSGFFIERHLTERTKIEAKTEIFNSRNQLMNLVLRSLSS
ncbi:MAG: DNA repair protein RecO [Pseudomonadota bacterium]